MTSISVAEAEHEEALDFMLPNLETDSTDPMDRRRLDAARFWRTKDRDGVYAYSSTLTTTDGKYGPARCFLARDGDKPVAHCCFRIGVMNKEASISRAYFGVLWTLEEHRRQGFGKATLAAAVDAVWQDEHVLSADILVDVKQEAVVKICQALGFTQTKAKKVNDGLVMVCWRKERPAPPTSPAEADKAAAPSVDPPQGELV
mmetsp:Transcript_78878/g.163954  ORF Transcript_78878/g.163954 Transcript_78878/m.163954 type:complete len:202 (+) Transcript_78878:32-637(+)